MSILSALGVFCFWAYVRPYAVTERELVQLFLWNADYFLERVAVPGGLARYIGEWLVQFFVYIRYGALVYALLFLSTQYLGWMVLRRLLRPSTLLYILSYLPALLLWWVACDVRWPMTVHVAVLMVLAVTAMLPARPVSRLAVSVVLLPVVYWAAGPATILMVLCQRVWWHAAVAGLLFALCLTGSSLLVPYPLSALARGIDYRWDDDVVGSYEDMTYCTLLRREQWETIVDASYRQAPQSAAARNAVCLALWYTRRVGEQELMQQFNHSRTVMQSCVSSSIVSDLYLHLGMLNMSQRAAFELMESIPNNNKSGRAMKRLAETALCTGQYEVADKYLRLLEQTLFYREWARSMRPCIAHPELLLKHPRYSGLIGIYGKTKDGFFH